MYYIIILHNIIIYYGAVLYTRHVSSTPMMAMTKRLRHTDTHQNADARAQDGHPSQANDHLRISAIHRVIVLMLGGQQQKVTAALLLIQDIPPQLCYSR